MQLKWFQVRDFQSIRDSGCIAVSDITCLVGKNEAGKSALLKALYKLNPVIAAEGNFDVTND
jgi:AAA15 family ATPase/GTPase